MPCALLHIVTHPLTGEFDSARYLKAGLGLDSYSYSYGYSYSDGYGYGYG